MSNQTCRHQAFCLTCPAALANLENHALKQVAEARFETQQCTTMLTITDCVFMSHVCQMAVMFNMAWTRLVSGPVW